MPRWVSFLIVGSAALLARAINLGPSWEIHIDEITYLRLSENVADHLAVRLYGESFYLHPPAYFFLEGGFLRLIQPTGDTIQQIYAVRWLNAGLAELTAVLIFLIGWRTGGRLAAYVAAGLFILDPFVVRMNSRTLLETSALFWVVLGYFFLHPAATVPRHRMLRAVVAGVCFGLALLTKDMTAFLTLAPLCVCTIIGRVTISRRAAVLAAAFTVLTYLPYPFLVALSGDWLAFAAQKQSGVSRFAGLLKITGFRRSGGPSFVDAVWANLDRLGSTYLLIGLGLIAIVLLLVVGGRRCRLLVVWTGSGYALIAYCILFGTLEEQFFYFLIVPTVIAVGVATSLAIRTAPRALHLHSRRARRGAALPFIGFLVLFLAWDSVVWLRVHTTPDNGYEQLLQYLHSSVPARTPIAAGTEAAEFLLDDYTTGKWITAETLRENHARYIIVSERQVEGGYAPGSPAFFSWVASHGSSEWEFSGPTHGLLKLIRLSEMD